MKKLKKLPVDEETHKLLNYDSMYYTPNAPFDEYEHLKKLSKLKEVKRKLQSKDV